MSRTSETLQRQFRKSKIGNFTELFSPKKGLCEISAHACSIGTAELNPNPGMSEPTIFVSSALQFLNYEIFALVAHFVSPSSPFILLKLYFHNLALVRALQ